MSERTPPASIDTDFDRALYDSLAHEEPEAEHVKIQPEAVPP
jgi:hypothetical protein